MFNNPFQMLREIAVILDNVRTVEILCNEISRNIYSIYDDWCGMDVSKNYIELFELLCQLQGYLLAAYDYEKINREQFTYAQQMIRSIISEFEIRMFKDLPKPSKKILADTSDFPELSTSIN